MGAHDDDLDTESAGLLFDGVGDADRVHDMEVQGDAPRQAAVGFQGLELHANAVLARLSLFGRRHVADDELVVERVAEEGGFADVEQMHLAIVGRQVDRERHGAVARRGEVGRAEDAAERNLHGSLQFGPRRVRCSARP